MSLIMKKILGIIGIILAAIAVLSGICAIYIYYEYSAVVLTKYEIRSRNITEDIDEGIITVISDFHNSNNYEKVLKATQDSDPNIIVVIGDFINMDDTSHENSDALMKGLLKIAPVYYISGNHERYITTGEEEILSHFERMGATIINNEVEKVPINSGYIALVGYQDIIYSDDRMRYNVLDEELKELYDSIPADCEDLFKVLLFHRGNLVAEAAEYPYDLILSGHLHGGQINLPIIREKILKDRVCSSEFCKGYYKVNDSKVIISGGLENHNEIVRIFNTPEVVSVRLNAIE